MAKAKVVAEAPTRPKPMLTLPRSKVKGSVGSKVKLIVTGRVVEENLGEEWEKPRRPTKRVEIQNVSSSTNSNRFRAKRKR